MGKAVLISIRPQWCELIVSGKKSVEVRKARPKLETPFKVYIYESLGKVKIKSMDIPTEQGGGTIDFYSHEGIGKIIGEFVCDTFVEDKSFGHDALFNSAACMTEIEAAVYFLNSPMYGWHISELKIYDKPKELSEFRRPCANDLLCESCAMYSENGNTCGNEGLQLTLPPQSWCYVEELKG